MPIIEEQLSAPITVKPHQYTVNDAIVIIKSGVMALALAEYYGIKVTNILGMVPDDLLHIYLDKEGFKKLSACKPQESVILNDIHDSALITSVGYQLSKLSHLSLFKKFPYFFEIINTKNYSDLNTVLENQELIKRCSLMQGLWQQWSSIGLAHILSSLQALQRHVSLKMKKPLLSNFELDLKNGLSVEYQAEIYSNHLYGPVLFDAWHAYLLDPELEKSPQLFLTWLKSLPTEKLTAFGITRLDDIPVVHYMSDAKERSAWQLNILPGNIVKNAQLPAPTKAGEEIEIIYTLGKSESTENHFFGGLKKRGTINHSSFFAGDKVDGAGRFVLKAEEDKNQCLNWVIHEADNNSGHIKPNDTMSINILTKLRSLGCDLRSIPWKSKWGSLGTRDETAESALKRLTNQCDELTVVFYRLPDSQLTSPLLKQIKKYADLGHLGSVDDLIRTHQLSTAEALATAFLIKEALQNHLTIIRQNTAHPDVAQSLANQAQQLLRMIGKKSQYLNEKLEKLIEQYQANYLVTRIELSQCSHNLFVPKAKSKKKPEPVIIKEQTSPILKKCSSSVL